jgi:unsaturated chondroitin disaccharide hydrolase
MKQQSFSSPGAETRGGESCSRREETARVLDLCLRKTRQNIRRLADNPEPGTWSWHKEGRYWEWNENFFAIGNWTTSFITGMALLAYQQTRDGYFVEQAGRLGPLYRRKVHEHQMDTMHDLGFLYSLHSVAFYRLTGEREHRETALRAAELLAGRFIPQGRFIRAWGRMDSEGVRTHDDGFIRTNDMAIIDCMMNLPLLHWAAAETGDRKFRDVAVAHADTTLAHFIRPDDSLFHAFRFDLETGDPKSGENYCGFAVGSHWARGTAWAIYGFAMSYRYTRDPRHLEACLRLAHRFITLLDADAVPVWDFRLTDGGPWLRDSSAAAIAVCGFQELERLSVADADLIEAKRLLLSRLCSEEYVDADETIASILRNGQVGRAQNAYTSWGDYFLMEALAAELGHQPPGW